MRRLNSQQQDFYLVALGEVVHDLRQNQGLSQQDLADLANVHRTYVSDIERGARNLTVTTVTRIAGALDIQLSKLFRMVDERADSSKPLSLGSFD
jgi:transcriptional regulator with XRE-family HTH domain